MLLFCGASTDLALGDLRLDWDEAEQETGNSLSTINTEALLPDNWLDTSLMSYVNS
jgi:hypothetical protein